MDLDHERELQAHAGEGRARGCRRSGPRPPDDGLSRWRSPGCDRRAVRSELFGVGWQPANPEPLSRRWRCFYGETAAPVVAVVPPGHVPGCSRPSRGVNEVPALDAGELGGQRWRTSTAATARHFGGRSAESAEHLSTAIPATNASTWDAPATGQQPCAGSSGRPGRDDAATVAYLGLYALQHRGQERRRHHHHRRQAAGACPPRHGARGRDLFGSGPQRSARGCGGAHPLFHDRQLGHRQRPTLLRQYSPLSRARPQRQSDQRPILKNELVTKGAIFQLVSSDSEVIVHLIARSEAQDPEGQIRDALCIEGAFSLVISVGRTIYAIVDPRGFRAARAGTHRRRGDRGLGNLRAGSGGSHPDPGAGPRRFRPDFQRRREGPGPLRRPRSAGASSSWCILPVPTAPSSANRATGSAASWARQLALEHPAPGADVVFSVPDSSNAMALGFAEQSGLKLEHGLIRNHYVGRTFINPTQASGWPR